MSGDGDAELQYSVHDTYIRTGTLSLYGFIYTAEAAAPNNFLIIHADLLGREKPALRRAEGGTSFRHVSEAISNGKEEEGERDKDIPRVVEEIRISSIGWQYSSRIWLCSGSPNVFSSDLTISVYFGSPSSFSDRW